MKPTRILSDEHKNILRVIDILAKKADELEKEKNINMDFFEKIIEFIRNYADKFHHAKEEDILFREFNKAAEDGCVHCNPVEQMLFEHDEGRKFVKGMEEGVNENNKNKTIENARNYCRLLKEHILKEDNILYPMAAQALSREIQEKISKEFGLVEKKKKADKERYEKFADSLEK